MSFKKSTFKNIYQIGGFSYVGQVLTFLSSVVLARLLLPEEYGFVAMIMVITNFASILTGIGIGSDIIRSSFGYTYHKSMMNLALYMGIILCLIIMAAAYPLSRFFGNSELIIPTLFIATQFILSGVNMVHYSLLVKRQKFTLVGIITLFCTILTITIMIGMAYFGFSYWSLIVPLVVVEWIKAFIFTRYTKIGLKIYPIKYAIVAFRYAKTIMGSILGVRIISYWGRNLDHILIGRNFGEASLGIYSRGYKFQDLVSSQFEGVFDSVLYPNLQKLKEANGDVYKEYLFFVWVICILSFPLSMLLIVFPEPLVSLLWGADWMMVADYLPYFGIAILGQLSISNTESIYKLYYRDLLLLKIGIFRSVVIVLFIIIGSLHSSLMIAIMLALVQVAVVVPVTVYYAFYRQMNFDLKTINKIYIPSIILFTGMIVTTWYDLYYFTAIQLVFYLIHLLLIQRNELGKLKTFVMEKIRNHRGE